MSGERFSKASLGRQIWKRADQLQEQFGFDPNDGTHQVERRTPEANRAYGEWNVLRWIADEWNLPVDK